MRICSSVWKTPLCAVKRRIGSPIRSVAIPFLGTTLLPLLCMLLPEHLLAGEPDPVILRTGIAAENPIWVGQRVKLQVDVLARDGWAQIKGVREFEVDGAYVIRLETQGTRLSESVSGQEYSGQRYELSLFPQRGGRITVPAVPVDVEVGGWGAQRGTSLQRLNTPVVDFQVMVPPGAENLQTLISTTELNARQQWVPETQGFKIGDAVKRTIELSGADISGMAFRPLEPPAMKGVGIYPGEPSVVDVYDRGSLSGKRTETITYVFEDAGAFELPEIDIAWWDVGQKKLNKIVLPALAVEIAAAPGDATEPTTAAASEDGRRMKPSGRQLLLMAALLLLAGLVWRTRGSVKSRWQARQERRGRSEKRYFRRLAGACRENDPKEAYRRLLAWLNRQAFEDGPVPLGQFLAEACSEKLSKEVAGLERRLFKKSFGRPAQLPWSGRELHEELARCRKKMMRSRQTALSHHGKLVPLNPD